MTARLDLSLVLMWAAALSIGFVMVASASVPLSDAEPYRFIVRHGVYIAAGVLAFLATVALPLAFWRHTYQLVAGVAILLCVVVLIPGIGVSVNGAQRWIGLGAFTLQAAEVAKVAVVIYLAGYFAKHHGAALDDLGTLLKPLGVVLLLAGLILLEPDFGTVVVLIGITGVLLFLAGARLRHFLLLALLAGGALAALSALEPYRLERLVTFLDPWESAFGSGYQLTQALIAVGRGGWFGVGLGEGVQKLFYLPEAHNDFIFAVIAEELGMLGALAVVALFAAMVLRMLRIARRAMDTHDALAGFLAYGAALLIGMQVLINIGVNIGVLPTKGLTLPFVSYGGNSLVACSAAFGLAVRASVESPGDRP